MAGSAEGLEGGRPGVLGIQDGKSPAGISPARPGHPRLTSGLRVLGSRAPSWRWLPNSTGAVEPGSGLNSRRAKRFGGAVSTLCQRGAGCGECTERVSIAHAWRAQQLLPDSHLEPRPQARSPRAAGRADDRSASRGRRGARSHRSLPPALGLQQPRGRPSAWPRVCARRDFSLARNPEPEKPRRRRPSASRDPGMGCRSPQPPEFRGPALGPEKRRGNWEKLYQLCSLRGRGRPNGRVAAGRGARGGPPARPGHPGAGRAAQGGVRGLPASSRRPRSCPAPPPAGRAPGSPSRRRRAALGMDWMENPGLQSKTVPSLVDVPSRRRPFSSILEKNMSSYWMRRPEPGDGARPA
nr:translation initiation factor IF-2-like [Equus asinus]